jgi:hypothetical protein
MYCRLQRFKDYSFVEFFVEFRPDSKDLGLPNVPLRRFENRSNKVCTLVPIWGPPLATIEPEFAHYCLHVYTTDSKSLGTTKKILADLKKNGTWLAYHDVVPKGGPIGPSVATYFGLAVSPLLYRLLYNSMKNIYTELEWTINAHPFVVYHGTARSSAKSILENGLKPTEGMLGRAVYFGSFWKAFRFASLTQDYKKRPGAILRCYAFWTTPYFMAPDKVCKCAKCLIGPVPGADHDGQWQSIAECIFLYPWHGGPIKNEEYASINADKIMIDSIGHCTANTEHHEPLNRNLTIE